MKLSITNPPSKHLLAGEKELLGMFGRKKMRLNNVPQKVS